MIFKCLNEKTPQKEQKGKRDTECCRTLLKQKLNK